MEYREIEQLKKHQHQHQHQNDDNIRGIEGNTDDAYTDNNRRRIANGRVAIVCAWYGSGKMEIPARFEGKDSGFGKQSAFPQHAT